MNDLFLPVDPVRAANSQMAAFVAFAHRHTGLAFDSFADLHAWACSEPAAFWTSFLDWCDLPVSGERTPALEGDSLEHAQFFPRLRLNYTQCLLRPLSASQEATAAIVFRDEKGRRDQVSRADLRRRVLSIAAALQAAGVQPGDRVAAVARNSIEVVEACYAAAAIGAIWSSVAPDLATEAVLGRFAQLEPVVLFVHGTYTHHGAQRDLGRRIEALVAALPSLRRVVMLDDHPAPPLAVRVVAEPLSQWRAQEPLELDSLPHFPFNHPLFILFSSGTTGKPKCLMHGVGGTLLEHLKEHRLHSDFCPDDLLFFNTSCGWMMWNWMIAGPASGLPIMVHDGSATFPDPGALLRRIDEEGVTVFGLSPAYVQFLRDSGVEPREIGTFDRLRAIQSTGSILYDAHFDWIRDHFKHVSVQSISGGTDIVGCFVLGNPLLPVRTGRSQSASLGMDVRVVTDDGLRATGTGELVCCNPFPSRPVGIWGDPDGRRLHDSYYAANAGLWTHGDRIELTDDGAAKILGRSDGTLKVHGIRIGPAEIYSIVLGIPGVTDAMAIEQLAPQEPGGSRIVLLVVLAGDLALDRPMILRIKRELRERASLAHVPAVIAQVSELPQTHNGKLSERAARDAANGRPIVNLAALKNPEVLDEISSHPEIAAARAS
jgi:acetoacetyl-CoA synthetase